MTNAEEDEYDIDIVLYYANFDGKTPPAFEGSVQDFAKWVKANPCFGMIDDE